MHSRRYAAAFLVFIAAFLATASVIPNGIVYAEGTKADEMCKAEVKNEKEYNPSKPWGKYWTEKRDGKNVTIFNLFGVTCYDITNKEKTTGHCLRKDRCLATKTAEGEDPKTCKETGACPDGGTSGTGGTAGSEGDESTDIPDEPKPDNSDGVLPLPDEPKPEVKPDPWTSGATPFDQGVPTNSFGDALQQVQNSDSWFAKTIESYFGSPDPMGPETSGIGNNFGAQSMMPQAPNGTESGIGSQGQSLYEQAFNNYSTPSSFPDPSTQSQGAAEPTFAERFGTWAGETVAAAGDMVRDAYEAVSDALVGPANSAESGVPLEKDMTDPFYDGLEPLQEMSPEEIRQIEESQAREREYDAGLEEANAEQVRATEADRAVQREEQATRDEAAYERSLKDAERNVPVPEQVQTDPQREVEQAIRDDAAREAAAAIKGDDLPPSGLPDRAPEGLSAASIKEEVDLLRNNVLEPTEQRIAASEERLKELRDTYNDEIRQANRFRDQNMVGLAKDGVTPQFKSQDDVDSYNKLISDAETARTNFEAERLTNELVREEYGERLAEVKELVRQYDNLPAEERAFEAIQQQKIDSQVRAFEAAQESTRLRAIVDDPNAAYTDRMDAALKLRGTEDAVRQQDAITTAMENRESCVYNCAFGKSLAEAYAQPQTELTPEQKVAQQGMFHEAEVWAKAQRALANPPDFSNGPANEMGIIEANPNAQQDLENWRTEQQQIIERANQRGEEFAGLKPRSAETQNYIDTRTGNVNPVLYAYQTYLDGLKSALNYPLGDAVTGIASTFTSDQQIIDGIRAVGNDAGTIGNVVPMGIGAQMGVGMGEQFLGAIGEPLPDTQLDNLNKSDAELAIQRATDIGMTALNATMFAPAGALSKLGGAFSAERLGAGFGDDIARAAGFESRSARMESQLGELSASYERALSRVGTAAAPTQGELAAMRSEIQSAQATLERVRVSEGLPAGTTPRPDIAPVASSPIPQEIRALTYGDAAPATVAAETTNVPRAYVNAANAADAAAISRGVEAGAIERAGVADVAGQRFAYEVKPSGEVVLSPAATARVTDLAPVSTAEINAIADARGVAAAATEPTVLRAVTGEVTAAERAALIRYEDAARDVGAWRAAPTGPAPTSRFLAAEQGLQEIGLERAVDGSIYRSGSGEILGDLRTAEPQQSLMARPNVEVPQYTKAGDRWFESNNLSKPISDPAIVQVLESKLPMNSVPAAQVAADMRQARAIAAADARAAERAVAERAAEARIEPVARGQDGIPLPQLSGPSGGASAPARTTARVAESQAVRDDLARLQRQGDTQALAQGGPVLSGPTSASIRDGITALKNAGGIPDNMKFANAYLENAVYRVSPEGNLTRVSDAATAAEIKAATNPTLRTTDAEAIGRAAKNAADTQAVAEAARARLELAKAYDGEILLANDVREAGRALAGDVDAIAQQAARNSTEFAWVPEAQVPKPVAQTGGGREFLTEVEQALANPFKTPTTEFARGGNVASDGLSPALQPYRAPQSTFANSAETALKERLGASTPAETLAQRAGIGDSAHPVPSPRTVVNDLAVADDIPLVSIKNAPGAQVGEALSLPEATAIRSFNSSLANYTKALESGGDVTRVATQVSNAYSELAGVGIRQRAGDGALVRESGETVAVRVSPPMAAQAAYAVVVAIDSQVREFATGATDDTFSFDAPDLRILSSDFGVQPPINVDEAIILKKMNDILESTRSRDSLAYILDDSGLEVRPQDGFIVRSYNGEVVARPAGGGTQPGNLPDSYVAAGPTPPLPVKLVRKDSSTSVNGSKTREIFDGVDYRGRTVVSMEVEIDGAIAKILDIEANRPGATEWTQFSNSVGPSAVRSLLQQLRAQHPEIVAIGGVRMSGSRFAGSWDPEDLGEPMEILLPSIALEPVPVRAAGNGPAALALGLALSVASPLPISAIADALGGPNNAFSIAAQAAQQPTPRDIERHAKAIADLGKKITGVASWYGTGSNGGTNPSDLTASGQMHRNTGFTAAMLGGGPKYPWGTRLLVKNVQEFLKDGSKNPRYGKVIEVVVTSTGSQPNRIIDLDPAGRDEVIGNDGTALVEIAVVSVPDLIDAMYKKGRTDLVGGGPVPSDSFDTRLAQIKQNPTIAIAQAKTLSGQPTTVNNPKGATTRGLAPSQQISIPDALTKTLGNIIKRSKTPDDKAVDIVAALEKSNPQISGLDKAVRLSRDGFGNTDIYKNQRDLAARQLYGTDVASDADIAGADSTIARTLANIAANQSTADLLAQKGLVAKGSTAQKNADGSYKITTPAGTTFKLAQVAPASSKPLTLDPIKQYTMKELREMYAPELEKFMQAAKSVPDSRFVTGDMLAVDIDIINEFFSVFKTVPQINGVGRSAQVNKQVGGDPNSDHLTGRATDWKTVGVPEDQKAELLRILQSKGLGLVTHSHGQGPHYHASMDRAGTPVERANLRVTENTPVQYALTNSSGFVVGGKSIALAAPTKLVTNATDIAFVTPDLPTMMTTNVQYTPTGEPKWQLPTPQVTLTAVDPLEANPVPDVTPGQDLAEVHIPNSEQIAAIPIPDQAPLDLNDVRQPAEPLAANPVPKITSIELGEIIPRGVIYQSKLGPVQGTDAVFVYAQPAMLRNVLFQSFGTYSYLPPSIRQKLYDAENDDDFILFTKEELDSIQWAKLDKYAYQVMDVVFTQGNAFRPPLATGAIEPGPQVFADGIDNQSVIVLAQPERTEPLIGETVAPTRADEVSPANPLVVNNPSVNKPTVELPLTLEQLVIPEPVTTTPVEPVQQPTTPAGETRADIAKKLADTQEAIKQTTTLRDETKAVFDANNRKIKEIAEYKADIDQAVANLRGTQRGLTMLRGLQALPDASQINTLKASANASNRLAQNAVNLENPTLAQEIRRFANLVNAMRVKENQTAGNRNAAVHLGSGLTKKTNVMIAEAKRELAGMGNLEQLKTVNKKLAADFAATNKTITAKTQEATDLTRVLAGVPESVPTKIAETVTAPTPVAPRVAAETPAQVTGQPTVVARPPVSAPEITVTTAANPNDQSRFSKAIGRTFDALARLDTKLLTDTAVKSYKKIAASVGLGPKETAVPTVVTTPFDAQALKGSEISYVCSTGTTCTERASDAVVVSAQPGHSYARVVAGDKPVVPRDGEAALVAADAQFLARAAGGFVTTANGGKNVVSQDITYSEGKLVGSKTVNPRSNQGLVIANSTGDVAVVDKGAIPYEAFSKLGVDIGQNAPTDVLNAASDFAKFDAIMRNNKLSAFTNLLLIKDGAIQNVQSSIAEPRRLLITTSDGRLAILTSTKDQTMLGITQIAKALGAKYAVNLDTGAYNEGKVAVQSGDAPYMGNAAESKALTNIYLGIRNNPIAVAPPAPTTPATVGPRTEDTVAGQPTVTAQPARIPSAPTPTGPVESFGVNTRRPEVEPESQPLASNDNNVQRPRQSTEREVLDQTDKPLTRDVFQEGGYTFLKRALAENLETGKPVVLDVDGQYFAYTYEPGQKSFWDGVKEFTGERGSNTYESLRETASAYNIDTGLAELANEKNATQQVASSVPTPGTIKPLTLRQQYVSEPASDGSRTYYYEAVNDMGEQQVVMAVEVNGPSAFIENMRKPNVYPSHEGWAAAANTIGASNIRSLLRQFQAMHPDVLTVTGQRMSGARFGGTWDPQDFGIPLKRPLALRPAIDTDRDPIPFSPISSDRALSFMSPMPDPTSFVQIASDAWPTIASPRPSLILEGEILPPARVGPSLNQVGELKPVLDLSSIGSNITSVRYIYGGTNALGTTDVVLDTIVAGDRALISMQNVVGRAAPSVEEVESLLRQFAALHPQVRDITPVPLSTTEERGLVAVRPPVNVLPALENILVTGPTLYVNSSGNVWPTLSGASADADLRKILAEVRADTSIEDGIRDIVATIKAGEPVPVAAEPSVPSVTPTRLADAPRATPEDVLDRAIREFAANNVARERAADRPITPSVREPQFAPAAPTVAQVQPPPIPESPAAPKPTVGERVKNVWEDTKLATRIARGIAFPAKTIKGNAVVNTANLVIAYSLTGPYMGITWPLLNVGYRYAFNLDYRDDVKSIFSRVKVALERSAADRAAFNAKQDLLNPNAIPTTGEIAVTQTRTSGVPRVEPQFADVTRVAPEISLEDGLKELVANIEREAPIVAEASSAQQVPEIRSIPTPEGSPVRTVTVVPLSKIDDLVAPKTAGTMRIYRGIGEAYDPTYAGPDPYFTPDYVDALAYAMKNAKAGQEPHLIIAEVNTNLLSDMYAYRQVQSALKERFIGLREITAGYIQLPKDWFDVAGFEAKFPHDIAGLNTAITQRQAEVPDSIAIMNKTYEREIAIAVDYTKTGPNHWGDLTRDQQDVLLLADPEYVALREQFKNSHDARERAVLEVAQEFRASNPLESPLPNDPIIEGVPPPRSSATDRLTESVGEFAADRPVVEKWGPFSNLRDWFRNLGQGGSGGSGNGGNGAGGGGGVGGTPDSEVGPVRGDPAQGSITDGLLSLARLTPGIANLISNAPRSDTDSPKVDVAIGNPTAVKNPASPASKPAETPKPDTTKTETPKPDTTKKPDTATPPPAKAPPPPSTAPPGGDIGRTGGSAPTGGTNAKGGGSGALNGLLGMLSGFMKGMTGAQAPQPQPQTTQPQPNGGVTVAMYARPNPAAPGQDVIVSWTSMNASTCSAFNASSTKVASGAPGSMFTTNVTGTTTFRVYCSNTIGQYASATVQILMQ